MADRPDDKFEIGKRFRVLRRRSHLTQSRLAEIIEISRSTVSKVENFHVLPQRRTWGKFCALEIRYRQAAEIRLPTQWF